jgi:hypothetical protein
MSSNPRFIHGVFTFEGRGLDTPIALGPKATYIVSADKRAQLVYLRAGNSSAELINLVLMRESKVMRYFPIGAKASVHVPLAVVEDIFPETKLELQLAAPVHVNGSIVIDLGLVEID